MSKDSEAQKRETPKHGDGGAFSLSIPQLVVVGEQPEFIRTIPARHSTEEDDS